MEKCEALRQIHFPDDKEKLDKARFSLVFEEFFLIQLKLALLREENNKKHAILTKKFSAAKIALYI